MKITKYPADPSNYTKGRTKKIRCITIHHMAGVLTASECAAIFTKPSRNGSSHYGIGYDGSVGQYVDEKDTAWTNSNWPSNCESITIETSNSAVGGSWPVNEVTFNTLVELVADIAKRNNLGELVPGDNLTWHSMFANTTCPGQFLKNRINEIATLANNINNPPTPDPAEKPAVLTDEQLALRVIKGEYGNGEARKKALGDRYDAVQALVNKMLMPNQEKKADPVPEGDLKGAEVVPIKLVDWQGTPLRSYHQTYTVSECDNKTAVLTAGGAIWARLNRENIRRVK